MDIFGCWWCRKSGTELNQNYSHFLPVPAIWRGRGRERGEGWFSPWPAWCQSLRWWGRWEGLPSFGDRPLCTSDQTSEGSTPGPDRFNSGWEAKEESRIWNWKKVSFNQRLHLNLDSIHYVFIGCFVYFCYGINHSRVLTDSNHPPNRGSQNFRRERPNTLMLSPVPISSIPTGSNM